MNRRLLLTWLEHGADAVELRQSSESRTPEVQLYGGPWVSPDFCGSCGNRMRA